MGDEVKKTIPALSVDTRVLMDRLLKTNVGDVVEYAELTGLIGRDVQDGARYVLDAAMRKLERDSHAVFGCIKDVGVKRLSSVEVVGTGERSLQRIRRTSKRAAFRQSIVPLDTLDDGTKTKSLTLSAMFGVLLHMTRPKVVQKLEAVCNAQMPTAKMLDEISKTL